MHHLGIATTRALSLVLTGDAVVRDVLYDGHPEPEPGAVVCRVAPSFVRFGNFQLAAWRGDLDLLRRLVEHTVRADYPHLVPAGGEVVAEDLVAPLFVEVCERTARLVCDWMRVGFVHGVLNTDNMSILGLTIDYGPYGWLESFDPSWTPNTTDASMRRYRYGAQPEIGQWNLAQLGNALASLVDDVTPLQAGLERYVEVYRQEFRSMIAGRLGWGAPRGEADDRLADEMFELLQASESDQVLFFRDLARVPVDPSAGDDDLLAPLDEAWYSPLPDELRARWAAWLRTWGVRVRDGGLDDETRIRTMNGFNPRFVLRNYLAQEAIDAVEAGDPSLLHELLDVLRHPYDEQPGKERFAARRPEWARVRVGCSMLSCSS
jgi:uncharacterized protein YdiU (UPF0061 family)